MKKYFIARVVESSCMVALLIPALHAQEKPIPAGQKDGVNLYVRFADPLDRKAPKVICDLENTTDVTIAFQRIGEAYGYGFRLHLIGEDGKEIEKTAEWLRLYETGSNIHTYYEPIKPHSFLWPVEMELQKAYGPKWVAGARLDIDWNTGEPRSGPGPFGGQWGIGSGVKGSLNLTSLTGKTVLTESEPQVPNTIEKRANQNPISNESPPSGSPVTKDAMHKEQIPISLPAQTANGFAYNGISWVWLIGAVVVLLGGAFWLVKKSAGRRH